MLSSMHYLAFQSDSYYDSMHAVTSDCQGIFILSFYDQLPNGRGHQPLKALVENENNEDELLEQYMLCCSNPDPLGPKLREWHPNRIWG